MLGLNDLAKGERALSDWFPFEARFDSREGRCHRRNGRSSTHKKKIGVCLLIAEVLIFNRSFKIWFVLGFFVNLAGNISRCGAGILRILASQTKKLNCEGLIFFCLPPTTLQLCKCNQYIIKQHLLKTLHVE